MAGQDINRDVLNTAYKAYSAGDGQPLLDAMAEDVVLELCVPVEAFRFAGPLRGKTAVTRALREIGEDYEWLGYRLHDLLVQGDLAVALTGGRIRHRGSDKTFDLALVDVVRMRGGKIVEFKEYFDSLGALMEIGLPASTFADLMASPSGRKRSRAKAKSSAKAAGRTAGKKIRPKSQRRVRSRRV